MEKAAEPPRPVRFKSQGRYKGVKEVKPFVRGNWKEWLQFQQQVNQLYIFLGMNTSQESSEGLQEVLGQLLVGRDLDLFYGQVQRERRAGATVATAIRRAMDMLTDRYCPLGTRDKLHEEIKGLRKSRNSTVEQYFAQFEALVQLEYWVRDDDGSRLSTTDQCKFFSRGMPRSWQMQVWPQQASWTDLEELRTRYMQCEAVEQQPEIGMRGSPGKAR
ncbi:hypothetical protein PF005_g29070 [Phytophthora fragariae]|uniref:Retrotransposon gag domain-containing protein n=2 Tax=Phytophthora fragariae TaxID=53985 RepID=A0A6A3VS79_9STRA|nr:hypothetical protein PF007_g28935 [Phytophthora fragariae]KAE9079916.1 hypothetical protein PF010_g22579 [Phytophthora fragariae]KAE9166755.1 hypothetical protein PF005_g29070 [Phytophthora fragariae]KAE9169255.1 hypothetical protein PF004_g28241 [Phytophthora fragariae]KAE9172429.1 hypothetical protein PF002_g29568 [Phytophthora fragariae]